MERFTMIGAFIGAFIGCLLLVFIDNPFVILIYFGFYLVATISIFSIYFEKLRKGYQMAVGTIIHEEREKSHEL